MTTITTWTLIVIMGVYAGYSGFTVEHLKDYQQCDQLSSELSKNINGFLKGKIYTKCVPTVEYVK